MEATCPQGHTIDLGDIADEGWRLDVTEHKVLDVASFPDGSAVQVERSVFTPYRRSIVVKCGHPAPTDDNDKALCGAVFEIAEELQGESE